MSTQTKVKAKLFALTKEQWQFLANLLSVGLMMMIPMLGFNQAITGPIINAILFLIAVFLGAKSAIIAGAFSATSALLRGVLIGPFTPALAPMVPFIIAGNAIMILGFEFAKKRHMLIGIATGSLLKYAFISYAAHAIVNSRVALPAPILQAMGTTQFFTAITGGLIAYTLIKIKSAL